MAIPPPTGFAVPMEYLAGVLIVLCGLLAYFCLATLAVGAWRLRRAPAQQDTSAHDSTVAVTKWALISLGVTVMLGAAMIAVNQPSAEDIAWPMRAASVLLVPLAVYSLVAGAVDRARNKEPEVSLVFSAFALFAGGMLALAWVVI